MALWTAPQPLLLASGSGTRRAMLEAAGIPVEPHPADIDERAVGAAASPRGPAALAELLAEAKAAASAAAFPGRLVVAADQTLSCEGRLFHKPADRAAARAQLLALRGRTHELHAAVSVWVEARPVFAAVATARLTMRTFSEDFLDAYLETVGAAALSSVGGYQLEGPGIQLFAAVEGDHFTILGLPLLPLLGYLRRAGHLRE